MSITNKIEYYKESLETFDDTLEKYRFLSIFPILGDFY